MNYQDLIGSMERFGSTKRDICIHSIGVNQTKYIEKCNYRSMVGTIYFSQFRKF